MKQFFEVLKQLFSSLFSTTPPTDDKQQEDKEDSGKVWSDSADIPQDTTIITKDLPFEIEPGVVIDDPKKDDKDVKVEVEVKIDGEVVEEVEVETDISTSNKRYMWCLDNGHAEETPGKRSAPFELDGINVQFFEYEFNRDVVGRIIASLKEKDIEFFNVVPEDEEDIALSERVRRANTLPSNLPKLYVSVHANAGPTPPGRDWSTASGVETWYYHGSKNGTKMATIFQKEIVRATGWRNRGLKSTRISGLYVLKHTSMPAILTENGFFNNRKEVKELMRDDIRQAIADAHVAAILEIEKKGLA